MPIAAARPTSEISAANLPGHFQSIGYLWWNTFLLVHLEENPFEANSAHLSEDDPLHPFNKVFFPSWKIVTMGCAVHSSSTDNETFRPMKSIRPFENSYITVVGSRFDMFFDS